MNKFQGYHGKYGVKKTSIRSHTPVMYEQNIKYQGEKSNIHVHRSTERKSSITPKIKRNEKSEGRAENEMQSSQCDFIHSQNKQNILPVHSKYHTHYANYPNHFKKLWKKPVEICNPMNSISTINQSHGVNVVANSLKLNKLNNQSAQNQINNSCKFKKLKIGMYGKPSITFYNANASADHNDMIHNETKHFKERIKNEIMKHNNADKRKHVLSARSITSNHSALLSPLAKNANANHPVPSAKKFNKISPINILGIAGYSHNAAIDPLLQNKKHTQKLYNIIGKIQKSQIEKIAELKNYVAENHSRNSINFVTPIGGTSNCTRRNKRGENDENWDRNKRFERAYTSQTVYAEGKSLNNGNSNGSLGSLPINQLSNNVSETVPTSLPTNNPHPSVSNMNHLQSAQSDESHLIQSSAGFNHSRTPQRVQKSQLNSKKYTNGKILINGNLNLDVNGNGNGNKNINTQGVNGGKCLKTGGTYNTVAHPYSPSKQQHLASPSLNPQIPSAGGNVEKKLPSKHGNFLELNQQIQSETGSNIPSSLNSQRKNIKSFQTQTERHPKEHHKSNANTHENTIMNFNVKILGRVPNNLKTKLQLLVDSKSKRFKQFSRNKQEQRLLESLSGVEMTKTEGERKTPKLNENLKPSEILNLSASNEKTKVSQIGNAYHMKSSLEEGSHNFITINKISPTIPIIPSKKEQFFKKYNSASGWSIGQRVKIKKIECVTPDGKKELPPLSKLEKKAQITRSYSQPKNISIKPSIDNKKKDDLSPLSIGFRGRIRKASNKSNVSHRSNISDHSNSRSKSKKSHKSSSPQNLKRKSECGDEGIVSQIVTQVHSAQKSSRNKYTVTSNSQIQIKGLKLIPFAKSPLSQNLNKNKVIVETLKKIKEQKVKQREKFVGARKGSRTERGSGDLRLKEAYHVEMTSQTTVPTEYGTCNITTQCTSHHTNQPSNSNTTYTNNPTSASKNNPSNKVVFINELSPVSSHLNTKKKDSPQTSNPKAPLITEQNPNQILQSAHLKEKDSGVNSQRKRPITHRSPKASKNKIEDLHSVRSPLKENNNMSLNMQMNLAEELQSHSAKTQKLMRKSAHTKDSDCIRNLKHKDKQREREMEKERKAKRGKTVLTPIDDLTTPLSTLDINDDENSFFIAQKQIQSSLPFVNQSQQANPLKKSLNTQQDLCFSNIHNPSSSSPPSQQIHTLNKSKPHSHNNSPCKQLILPLSNIHESSPTKQQLLSPLISTPSNLLHQSPSSASSLQRSEVLTLSPDLHNQFLQQIPEISASPHSSTSSININDSNSITHFHNKTHHTPKHQQTPSNQKIQSYECGVIYETCEDDLEISYLNHQFHITDNESLRLVPALTIQMPLKLAHYNIPFFSSLHSPPQLEHFSFI